MAECLRQEAEASAKADVILVDRPVLDAFGYLLAALEISGRRDEMRRIDELRTVARAHTGDYDVLIITSLDRGIRSETAVTATRGCVMPRQNIWTCLSPNSLPAPGSSLRPTRTRS